eukprot:123319-Rhodomonas_salina.1
MTLPRSPPSSLPAPFHFPLSRKTDADAGRGVQGQKKIKVGWLRRQLRDFHLAVQPYSLLCTSTLLHFVPALRSLCTSREVRFVPALHSVLTHIRFQMLVYHAPEFVADEFLQGAKAAFEV